MIYKAWEVLEFSLLAYFKMLAGIYMVYSVSQSQALTTQRSLSRPYFHSFSGINLLRLKPQTLCP